MQNPKAEWCPDEFRTRPIKNTCVLTRTLVSLLGTVPCNVALAHANHEIPRPMSKRVGLASRTSQKFKCAVASGHIQVRELSDQTIEALGLGDLGSLSLCKCEQSKFGTVTQTTRVPAKSPSMNLLGGLRKSFCSPKADCNLALTAPARARSTLHPSIIHKQRYNEFRSTRDH